MNKPHKTTNTRTKTAKTQHAKKRKKSESIYPVINLDTLKRLYDASIKLRDRKPWELLTEQDLFGFVDPVTGENAYCHITGQCGDYQALSVYRGDRGLKFILDLMTTVYTYNYTYNYLDIMLNCDKLDVSFENFPYIDEPDREILNRLKIKTWNRKKQPIFRDFLPGYYPWPVDEKGAEMLIRAIDVTLLALDKLEQVNQSFSGLFQNGQIFMFSLDSKDKSGQWQEKIVKIKKPLPEKIPEIIVDEVKIKRLNKLIKDCRGKWETGPYYIDEPVMPEIPKEGNRAFFPALLLWMEKETHFIISQALVKKEEEALQKAFQARKKAEEARQKDEEERARKMKELDTEGEV